MQEELHARIGQIVIGRQGEVLKTVLGSCVGIALIWKQKGWSALAHCLLPTALPGQAKSNEARYVDETLPLMLKRLGVAADEVIQLQAVVVGGGQMIDSEKPYLKFVVGTENLKMAKECLQKHGIKVIAFEPGGMQGTKIRLDSQSGEFEVEKIPRSFKVVS